jgi:preprotein translocase subunit YajC
MKIPTNDLTLLSRPSIEAQITQSEDLAGAPESGGGGILDTMLVPMMLCFVVFWLIVVRPEKKNRKVREEMLGGLKKGDPVVTSGGIHGSVVSVKEEVVTIQVADGVRMRFSIHAVQTLVSKDTDEKESD